MDGEADSPVVDSLSPAEAIRTFLYTRYELVTVRAELIAVPVGRPAARPDLGGIRSRW